MLIFTYRCPVHGELEMSLRTPTDAVPMYCPLTSWSLSGSDNEYANHEEAKQAAVKAGLDPEQANYETQRCAADIAVTDKPPVDVGS